MYNVVFVLIIYIIFNLEGLLFCRKICQRLTRMSISNTVIPDINNGIKVCGFCIALHGVMYYVFSNKTNPIHTHIKFICRNVLSAIRGSVGVVLYSLRIVYTSIIMEDYPSSGCYCEM